MKINNELKIKMLKKMVKIRLFEEEIQSYAKAIIFLAIIVVIIILLQKVENINILWQNFLEKKLDIVRERVGQCILQIKV